MRRINRDYKTTSDVWKYYWKEKEKREKKLLTNKRK